MNNIDLNNKSNKIKVLIISMTIFTLSIIGISYAYLTIQITGNDTASSMRVKSTKKSLVYNDVQISSGSNTIPGWSETKTLTVTNNGRTNETYTIIWKDILNTIINDELVISATCTASSGTCDAISEKIIPTYTTQAHNVKVKRNISIAPGVTHTYTVTITFKDTGSNQDYNQRKRITGTLNIEEYEPPFKSMGTDSATGLPVVRSNTITSEEFYDITNAINYTNLISTNGNIYNYASDKTILLAKYNLYVGRNCTSSSASSCTPISTSASEYGLQSADAKGYVDSSTPRVAVVPFSGSSTANGYWYDSANSTIYSKYGTSYDASNIYDTTYNTAPNYSVAFSNNAGNANYSIAYYVEEYVDRLGIEGEGRLLTYTEANAMTQAQRTNGAYYWLGSANGSNYMRFVRTSGTLGYDNFINTNNYGVRPVIVINTSDIQSS